MGNVTAVLSCKGGVGKTTLSAALSYNSARLGIKTLAVDMDFGVRSLDLCMGHENSLAPNAYEVMTGAASLREAAVQDPREEKLYFLSAPIGIDADVDPAGINEDSFRGFLEQAMREFDLIYLDMPAGFGVLLELAARTGRLSSALVVCTHNSASIRAAEKTGSYLYERRVPDIRLIINEFFADKAKAGTAPGVVEIIERSSVPLAGVVPYDRMVDDCVRSGVILSENKKCAAGKAAWNIARRLAGETVPLLDGIAPAGKRKKFY